MVSGPGMDVLCDSSAFPCAVCRGGVRENSIQCSECICGYIRNIAMSAEDLKLAQILWQG